MQKVTTLKKFLTLYRILVLRGWKARINGRNHLRLQSPRGEFFCHCPVTALCASFKHNGNFVPQEFEAAGAVLGMPKHLCKSVVMAADNNWNHSKRLRRRFLDSFGLKDQSPYLI